MAEKQATGKRLANNWRDAFCDRIGSGRSARLVATDPDMPSEGHIYRVLKDDPDFAVKYALACQRRADAIVDEAFEIADDGSNDWMQNNDPENAGWLANGEHLGRSKVRVDLRKWAAARLNPKVYGDRVAIDAKVEAVEVSEAERLDKLVAQIPVLNNLLARRGFKIVAVDE